jgi:hypothetical protein
MKKLFYYQPIIKPVASNGSERFGVHAVTQIWSETTLVKMELSVFGNSTSEAIEKLKLSLKGENESIELPCEYYLCGKEVIKQFKPFHVSKSFKSGFENDEDLYFVAWLNFEEVEKYYEQLEPNQFCNSDYCARECVPGTMDVLRISMRKAKVSGLLLEISEKLDLTTQKNQAMAICNLAQKYNCSPVQLIDKYL